MACIFLMNMWGARFWAWAWATAAILFSFVLASLRAFLASFFLSFFRSLLTFFIWTNHSYSCSCLRPHLHPPPYYHHQNQNLRSLWTPTLSHLESRMAAFSLFSYPGVARIAIGVGLSFQDSRVETSLYQHHLHSFHISGHLWDLATLLGLAIVSSWASIISWDFGRKPWALRYTLYCVWTQNA